MSASTSPEVAVRPRRARRTGGRVPLALLVPAVAAMAFLAGPFVALLASVPWGRLGELATSGPVLEALWLSLRTAAIATAVCVALGVPLAWLLARTDLPHRDVLRAAVTIPLALPPVVGGVALLSLLGRRGLVGQYLDGWFGVTIPFTTAAVVIAEAFVALPFLVLAVDGALRGSDRGYEDAAAALGGSPWYVFRRVTLPLAAPSIVAGAVLSFARAVGEFGATVTFAGSFPGTTRTMPLAIYLAMESEPDLAVAMSMGLVLVSLAVLVGLRSRWVSALPGVTA